METREFIICRGIPGSGKSFWSKSWVSGDPETRVHVSLDDIRLMLGGGTENYWIPSRENLVRQIRKAAIRGAMDFGYNIVVDCMNLNPLEVQELHDLISEYNHSLFGGSLKYVIRFQDFLDVPLETCIERDSKRPRPIGEEVIRGIYNKYRDILEGRDETLGLLQHSEESSLG